MNTAYAEHTIRRRSASDRTLAMPRERTDHACFPVTVTAVKHLTPHVRRLTLTAPQLQQLTLLGPDEFFGLVMPKDGQALPDLSRLNGSHLRLALAELTEQERPELRWYTVRHHRPARSEVDVDIVVHGDTGPGSAWVRRAKVGQRAAYQTGTACYPTSHGGRHLIIGDETAVPAIASILEQLGDDVWPHVLIETPSPVEDLPDLPTFLARGVKVLRRGQDIPGSALLAELHSATLPDFSYAWVCGEQRMTASARRHLVETRGMPRESIYFCAYWILGRPRC